MHARERSQLLDALPRRAVVISAAASVVDDPACRAAMTIPGVRSCGSTPARRHWPPVSIPPTNTGRPMASRPRRSWPSRPHSASHWPSLGALIIDVDDLSPDEPWHGWPPRRSLRARLASGRDRSDGRSSSTSTPASTTPRPALRLRLARGRAGRGDLRRRATSTPGRSRATRGRCSSWPAGRTSRSRSGARCRSSGRSRRRPRRTARRASATPSCRRRRARSVDRHAVDLIIEEARRRPGEVTLVTLGPLTNLAVARPARAGAARACSGGWSLMGGAYRVPGNTAPTTEWNIHCDPEAAKIVFSAGRGA